MSPADAPATAAPATHTTVEARERAEVDRPAEARAVAEARESSEAARLAEAERPAKAPGHPEACDVHRAPGRPRSSKADQAILAATVDLLLEAGYRGVTIEGVAARAGVAKTTIYRRWPSKAEMVVEAVREIAHKTPVSADTGGREGVTQALVGLISGMNRTHMAEVMTSLAIEMAHDAELAEAVQRGMIDPRRTVAHALLRRGVETGEIRSDVDFDVASEMLGGPLLYRVLFTHEPIDEQLVRRTVETLMKGIGTRGARPEPTPGTSRSQDPPNA
jgi:AcrR family transcriptional regulator